MEWCGFVSTRRPPAISSRVELEGGARRARCPDTVAIDRWRLTRGSLDEARDRPKDLFLSGSCLCECGVRRVARQVRGGGDGMDLPWVWL